MAKKLFKPSKIGAATVLISLTSLISYGIGLFRDRIIATNFGTSAATDTYNASFLIPDILFNLFIAGALSAAFLPIFSDYLQKNKEEAYKLANTMLTSATLVISSLSIIAFIFMDPIISLSFSEASPIMQQDIINMTRIMLVSAIIFAISNTLGNILMSFKHFFSYALSPIFYNAGIILGVIFLHEEYGIYSAAIGVIIGTSFHCLIRVIDLFSTGYRFKPQLKIFHPGFKKIIKLMIPKSVSLIAWQVNLYIFAIVGIKTMEGGLAAFHFARNIQSFAVSLFGIAFATAVFPFLTIAASKKDKKKYTEHMQKTIQRILFFTVPAAVGIMTLSSEIVELILSGGVFDQKSIELTSLILFFFAISIPFESLAHILARGFYALQNTLTPTIVHIISMCIIAGSTYFLAPTLGIEWFSIGFGIGFTFYVITMAILLRKHFKDFSFKVFTQSLGKTIIASGIMAIVVLISAPIELYIPIKLATVIRIILGGSSFFFVSYFTKSPELPSIKYILGRIIKKQSC
jgi:putative peptidoglycan lipid II flippase